MLPRNSFASLIFFSLIIGSMCYLYIIPSEISKSKDHEGHCYFETNKLLLKPGESKLMENCEKIECYQDYSMRVVGCGTFSIHDPKCKRFERDLTKDYPLCCTTFICVEPNDEYSKLNEIENNTL